MTTLVKAKIPMCPKCKVELEYLNIGELFVCPTCGRQTNCYFQPDWGHYAPDDVAEELRAVAAEVEILASISGPKLAATINALADRLFIE